MIMTHGRIASTETTTAPHQSLHQHRQQSLPIQRPCTLWKVTVSRSSSWVIMCVPHISTTSWSFPEKRGAKQVAPLSVFR